MPTSPSPLTPAGALAGSDALSRPGSLVPAPDASAAELRRAFEGLLARELDAGDLTAAWELTARARLATPGGALAFFHVTAGLFEARRQGNTRLALPSAMLAGWALPAPDQEHLARFVAEELAPKRPASAGLATLLGDAEDSKPLVRLPGDTAGGVSLAFQRDVAKERRLARAALARMTATAWSEAAVEQALARGVASARPLPLVAEQRAAVVQALSRRLALIAGGPGTGKTTIILSLVRAALELGLPSTLIALAAPTGKAARRIEEALGELRQQGLEATTLHGLLGLGPGLAPRPLFQAGAPLPHRLVVVDEASMIGLDSLDLLVEAVDPRATLVLLGDPDQLPSVEAGAVFRALVEAPELRAIRLSQSHRMRADDAGGASILGLAQEVKAGHWPATLPTLGRDGPLPTTGVHHVSTLARVPPAVSAGAAAGSPEERAALSRFFARWRDQHLSWRGEVAATLAALPADTNVLSHDGPFVRLVQESTKARLLAVTRGQSRPTGVASVNEWFHADWVRAQHVPAELAPRFLPGEPVMITENDPERGLANGDTGVVVRLRTHQHGTALAVALARGGELVSFPLGGLERNLTLAYAVTVHKAQGSEHEHVALLLPTDELPLFGRELLYTALTRARRSVLLVGEQQRAAEATARATLRQGTLARWLGARDAAP